MGDVTEKLLEDGIEAFVTPFDKLIAGVESSKEAAVTGRPPTIESSIPDELEAPLAKRVETRRRGGRGAPRLAQGRDAVGRPGARDRQPAGLADDLRARCSSTRTT